MQWQTRDASVVLRYYVYRAVGNPGFIAPVYVLYLLASDLSYAQVGAIGAIQSVVVVAGEVPTGYLGDRIGRRNSLVAAQLLYAASTVGMIVGDSFAVLAAAFGLLSLGTTFVSGSEDAWLYDTLKEQLSEDRYTHVRGRGGAIGQWVMAATMVAGSLLYVVEPVYPFVALLGMRILTLVTVLSLPKTAQYAADRGDDADGRLTVAEALPVVRDRVARPPLRAFVAYMAVFFGVASTAVAFVQPIAVDTLEATAGGLLSAVGVPEAASLGVLYAAFTAVSAVASDHASDLEAWLGVRKAVLVVPVAASVLFVAPAVAPVLAFPMFFALRASQSLLRPITGRYLNDHVESVGRATVLSVVSLLYAVARVPFALGSGVVADLFSPLVAVAALGTAFLVVGGALFVWRPPVPAGAETETPAAAPSD